MLLGTRSYQTGPTKCHFLAIQPSPTRPEGMFREPTHAAPTWEASKEELMATPKQYELHRTSLLPMISLL